MSNRSVREGVVEIGREARVSGYDPLLMRHIYGGGLVWDAIVMAREDEPGHERSAAQHYAELVSQL